MRKRNRLAKVLLLSHRYLGICSALFIVTLALSGISLNHTDDLTLNQRYIQTTALLDWYGIDTPVIESGFLVEKHWLTQVETQLYLDDTALTGCDNTLMGAIALHGVFIGATADELILFASNGELIERITHIHGLPGNIKRIGLSSAQVVIDTQSGHYSSNESFTEWQLHPESAIAWAQPQRLPPPLSRQLQQHHRGKGLTMERFLLDLHSGRIGGRAGVILMDTMALLFLLLALLGVWMWAQRLITQK